MERIIGVLTCSRSASAAAQDSNKSATDAQPTEATKTGGRMRSTRASTLIASAPATLDPAHQSEDGIRATSGSDVAPAVTTETVAEHTAMHLSHSSAQRVQPCAEGAGVRTLAVTSAGANSSHVSYDAAHGERSRTAPLAVTSEGANSQASGVFEAGLSEAEMRQRIRQGMGSGVGPRFDIVELAQCMAAFEQSVQEEVERREYETGACARPNADLFLSMAKTDWASLNSTVPRRKPKHTPDDVP